MNAPSNTLECILELRGLTVVGAVRSHFPMSRASLAKGTTTILLSDGTGFTFSNNGSFWREDKDDVKRVLSRLVSDLENTKETQKAILQAAGTTS